MEYRTSNVYMHEGACACVRTTDTLLTQFTVCIESSARHYFLWCAYEIQVQRLLQKSYANDWEKCMRACMWFYVHQWVFDLFLIFILGLIHFVWIVFLIFISLKEQFGTNKQQQHNRQRLRNNVWVEKCDSIFRINDRRIFLWILFTWARTNT